MVSSSNRPFTPGAPESQEMAWMSSIEARVDTLETQQRLFSSSVRGGAIVAYTNELKQVGRIGVGGYSVPGGTREAPVFSVTNPDQFFHVLIDMEDGWVAPRWQHSWVPDTFVAVTSASFVDTYKSMVNVHGFALVVRLLITADASTTGRIRLEMGGNTSDEVTIAGGEQKVVVWAWDLTDKIAFNSFHLLRVRGQRDTGVGNINVYAPEDTYTTSLRTIPSATSGGIPTT